MNLITHAFAPVLLASCLLRRPSWLQRFEIVSIALAGALPDLLNPHISLEARMTSWSHGLPCWLAFSLITLILVLLFRRHLHPALWPCLSLAYLLHLFCDAISGGINWLYPVRDAVWGQYWVPPLLWFPLDAVILLLAWFRFRSHFGR